jgi:hypothetical protein
MCTMKPLLRALAALVFVLLASGRHASAQATGSLTFTARLTPSSGVAEPVRGLPFYLLRKSFADIQREAEASQPKPDMDKFIDALTVSKELKACMKKYHSVHITADEFINNLTAKEIFTITEFWKAYDRLNSANSKFGYPVPKYTDRERAKNPAKYQRDVDDYHSRILHYIETYPDSRDGMDSDLVSIDPSARWMNIVESRRSAVRTMALDLAQSRYLAAQAQTDLNGRAQFSGLPPGNYWLTSLNVYAEVGDTRAKWDVPVTVRADSPMQLTLANYNSVPPAKPSN